MSAANASEKIIIRSGILQESVSVTELSTFAQTGKLSQSLQVYFDLAQQNPAIVRRILTTPIQASPLFLDKFLNSVAGYLILEQLSEVVHTRSRKADKKALRSALVLSASDDKKITLIEIIKNYPTPEVEMNGKHLRSVFHKLQKLQSGLNNIFDILF
ncbi:MAG: alpha/beta hydrolase [Mastigocoleus sp.]